MAERVLLVVALVIAAALVAFTLWETGFLVGSRP